MTAFRDILSAARRRVTPQAAPWRPLRQDQLAQWAARTFPQRRPPLAPQEQLARLVREVLDLARTGGLPEAELQRLLRESGAAALPGPLHDAAGAVGVALLRYCEAAGLDADKAEMDRLNALLSLPPEFFGAAAPHKPPAPTPIDAARRRRDAAQRPQGAAPPPERSPQHAAAQAPRPPQRPPAPWQAPDENGRREPVL